MELQRSLQVAFLCHYWALHHKTPVSEAHRGSAGAEGSQVKWRGKPKLPATHGFWEARPRLCACSVKSCEAALCILCHELEKEPFLPHCSPSSRRVCFCWAALSSRLYLRSLVPWRELMVSGTESSFQIESSRDMC